MFAGVPRVPRLDTVTVPPASSGGVTVCPDATIDAVGTAKCGELVALDGQARGPDNGSPVGSDPWERPFSVRLAALERDSPGVDQGHPAAPGGPHRKLMPSMETGISTFGRPLKISPLEKTSTIVGSLVVGIWPKRKTLAAGR